MAFGGMARSMRQMKSVSLAAMLACCITLVAAPAAMAGSGEPASNVFRKKVTESHAPAAQNWSHGSAMVGKATTVSRVVNDGSVSPFLAPDSSASMQKVADKYAAIVSAGGWPKVPSGKLKKGSTGKAVGVLNKRLFIEGYLRAEATSGEYAEVYTTATEDAVSRFQSNNGLAVTGAIDGPTLNQLNVPAEKRLSTIRANIPRIAEYAKDLGSRYVVVNVPAQQIETVSDGKVYSIHNAIVGRPSRPTPVVMTPLTIVRFNPYWNAPPSIVEKDIVPRMMSSGASKVMADMNMKIFKGVGGPEVDPNSVKWRNVVVDDYHFRQEPGGSNAMATAKIEFTSPFGIYLHDTPEPQLFGSGERLFSSGCVRVQNVATLINWILQGQDGIDSSRIAELADTKERLDTPIANAPQLRVAYLTAWPTADGVAAFRRDVYELDGTGFVVGQPLPVGESQGGQRFVLKPIPRSLEAVDSDEAFGFASLFRSSRNTDKQDSTAMAGRRSKSSDSLLPGSKTTKTTAKDGEAGKSKTVRTASGKKPGKFMVRNGNSDKEANFAHMFAAQDSSAKKPLKKSGAKTKSKTTLASKTAGKTSDKSKTAKAETDKASTAKKVVKKDETTVAAKKPETAAKTASKTAAADTKSATDAKAKKPAATATAKKPATAQCKPGTDGKLPSGCKTPSTAKKPEPKPEKTATAAN